MSNCQCIFKSGEVPKIVIGYGAQLNFQLVDENNIPVPLDLATEITLSIKKADNTMLTLTFTASGGITKVTGGTYGQFMADVVPANSALLLPGPGDGLTNMFATYTIPGVNDGNPVPLELNNSVFIVEPSVQP